MAVVTTHTTLSMTIWTDIGINFIVWMPLGAMGLVCMPVSTPVIHVIHILLVGSQIQMFNTNTEGIIAVMKHPQPIQNIANIQNPCGSRCARSSPVQRKLSTPFGNCPGPPVAIRPHMGHRRTVQNDFRFKTLQNIHPTSVSEIQQKV